jgi:hypothetical protein
MNTFVPQSQDRGPEQLKHVLGRLFFAKGLGRASEQARLEAAWSKAVGPDWNLQSQVLGLKRGIVDVLVANALVHQHLVMLKSQYISLLRQEVSSTIRDIRFKVGA